MKGRRLTVSDLAKESKLNPNTIRKLADEGRLTCKRDFQDWRIFPQSAIKKAKELAGVIEIDEGA